MASKSSASELTRLINQLRKERQHHLDSIAEIDQTFKEFGINAGGVPVKGKPGRKPKSVVAGETPAAGRKAKGAGKRGRKPGKGTGKRGRRRKGAAGAAAAGGASKPKSPWGSKFPMTGDELILTFIKDKGNATTEEIRKHWLGSGRKGKAENNLTNLVKSGKIKRTKTDGKPGSTYSMP